MIGAWFEITEQEAAFRFEKRSKEKRINQEMHFFPGGIPDPVLFF
jgi:hypothetical protein